MSRAVIVLLSAAVFLGTGCGSEGPSIIPVAGKLTRDGKPVANLEVYFIPAQGRSSVGSSDKDGKFNLQYSRDEVGALVGAHTVFVTYNPPAETGYPAPADLKLILAKYGSKESSPLKVEVKPGMGEVEIKID